MKFVCLKRVGNSIRGVVLLGVGNGLLTDHGEINGMPNWRGGGYLALVNTGVLFLRVSYPQCPFFCVRDVHGLEALIACVGVTTDCQQVNVPMPHPRDLEAAEQAANI